MPCLVQVAQDDVGGWQVHASCQCGGSHQHLDGACSVGCLDARTLVRHEPCMVVGYACRQWELCEISMRRVSEMLVATSPLRMDACFQV